MEHLYGTYRGFFPTDESNLGLGEARLVFDARGLELTMATGLMVVVKTFTKDQLHCEIQRNIDDLVDLDVIHVITISSSPLVFSFGSGDEEGVLGAVVETPMGLTPFVKDMSEERFEQAATLLATHMHCSVDGLPRIELQGRARTSLNTQ